MRRLPHLQQIDILEGVTALTSDYPVTEETQLTVAEIKHQYFIAIEIIRVMLDKSVLEIRVSDNEKVPSGIKERITHAVDNLELNSLIALAKEHLSPSPEPEPELELELESQDTPQKTTYIDFFRRKKRGNFMMDLKKILMDLKKILD